MCGIQLLGVEIDDEDGVRQGLVVSDKGWCEIPQPIHPSFREACQVVAKNIFNFFHFHSHFPAWYTWVIQQLKHGKFKRANTLHEICFFFPWHVWVKRLGFVCLFLAFRRFFSRRGIRDETTKALKKSSLGMMIIIGITMLDDIPGMKQHTTNATPTQRMIGIPMGTVSQARWWTFALATPFRSAGECARNGKILMGFDG